jgi:DNA-binding transcriptional ArsR family regulator
MAPQRIRSMFREFSDPTRRRILRLLQADAERAARLRASGGCCPANKE